MGIFDIMKKIDRIQTVLKNSNIARSNRTKIIKVRVTEDEYEAFKLLGKSMGMSGMIRYAVLDLYLNNFIKDYS